MRLAILLLLSVALVGCRVQFNAGTDGKAQASSGSTEEQAAVRAAASQVLTQLDAKLFDSAWEASAPSLKESANRTAFAMGIQTSRAMFGTPKSRAITGYAFPESVEGAPPGEYGIVFYATDFSKVKGVEEQVVLARHNGEWRLAGYWAEKSRQVKVL